jgi:hypothetical protein
MKSQLVEAVGWLGVVAVLTAYALSSLGVASSQSLLCIGLNLSGAAAIAWVSYYKQNWQSVVLNIVWAGIALVALASLLG